MAYSRENMLRRIVDIQNIVIEHKKRGVTQKWLYDNLFALPPYRLSYSTFNFYMSINAKAQLKDLLERKKLNEELKKRQLIIFYDSEMF